MIGWGIVGCGALAPAHARAVLANAPRARLVGVCDVVPERSASFAQEFEAPFATSDLDALLARDDVDVISICTPSGLHAQGVVAAARAGKHVLCEKPLDITRKHMDAAIAATRAAGVKLGCVFQRRTLAFTQHVRTLVQEGAFGRLLLAELSGKDYRPPAYYRSGSWRGSIGLDRGCLMNQGVHAMDLLLWLAGEPVVEVSSFWDHLDRDVEAEDTIVGTLRFASGALGTVLYTTALSRQGLPLRLGLHGTEGNVVLGGEEPIVERRGEALTLPGHEAARGPDIVAASDPASLPPGHDVHVRDLIGAIDEDREPLVSGESARVAIDVILALYEASDSRSVVRLPPPQAV